MTTPISIDFPETDLDALAGAEGKLAILVTPDGKLDPAGRRVNRLAKQAVARLNPNVAIETWPIYLDEKNGGEVVGAYDLVADGSDNFDTRFAVADLCEQYEKTLVSAAVGQFDGSITTLKPHIKDEEGNAYPRYRDLFPTKPPEGMLPTCEEAGILGALTGILGSMQALEIIKEITGTGESLAGRLIMYDARAARFQEIRYERQ